MLRARKMSAMTQARNARTVISGSLLDQTVSPIARISCNSSFRPHLHVMFVTMNYEHMPLVATSVKGKVTYTYKLTELIATLLKSCSTLSEPTSQSSIFFSRHRKTENLASKQGME